MKFNFYSKNSIRCFLIFLLIAFSGIKNDAKAQMVLVPDSNFRNALIAQGFGSCFIGNYIDSTCNPVRNLFYLDVSYKDISDLSGLESFHNLLTLNCSSNNITHVANLPVNLTELKCDHNQLLTIPNSPNLEILQCEWNQLIALPYLVKLKQLLANSNNLTSLPTLSNSLEILAVERNYLTSLPTLPNSLTALFCGKNQLTSLPILPNSINDLHCDENKLSTLPSLPSNLILLDCSFNPLYNLPTLPPSLVDLKCVEDSLTILTLNDSLIYLNCGYNQIIQLPRLPLKLKYLFCNNNKITQIDSLPLNLYRFDCSSNQLNALPILPPTLLDIYCDNNQITYIPNLSDSLLNFNCSSNANLYCLPDFKKILYLDFNGTAITCIPTYGNVTFSSPLLSSLPLCSAINICKINWNISGKTYFDANTSCNYDNTIDSHQSNLKINLYQNGNLIQQAFTGGEGYYSFDTDNLVIYETRIDTTDLPFDVYCPATGFYTDTLTASDSLKYNRDFALKCKSGFDLAATSIHANGFLPARIVNVNIAAGDYSNMFGAHCASGVSGTLKIVLNGDVSFYSAANGSLTPNVNGDTLIYTIADFGMIDYTTSFNFSLQVDTTAILGSQVCISVAISPGTDNNSSNNFISQCFTIVGSFDPNEKQAYPSNGLDINGDHWLTYTINFQNTGTAEAEHIYITDTLDANLDLSSFQILAYSHQPYVQILDGGISKFNFPNINLPDSTNDEANSHGYVQYKIKAKDNLALGTLISNTANIYFDFNAPVITNTTVNEVIACTANVQNLNKQICRGISYDFNGVSLNQAGDYTQTFVTTSGCDSVINLRLNIIPPYAYTFAQNICSGESYNFNGQNLTLPGSYSMTISTAEGCDSILNLILNLDQTDTLITLSNNTLSASAINSSFQWIDCNTGLAIPGETSKDFTFNVGGNYAVVVRSGSCIDTSSCHTISLTSLNENNSAADFIIQPNPANDFIIIESKEKISSLILTDKIGRVLHVQNAAEQKLKLSTADLAGGVYFISVIYDDQKQITKKFIKL